MGFITNASDLKKVTTDKDKTAQAIADGITDYLKQAGLY
jgi:N-acetylmuramoyl-L-alanine amidase